MAREQPSHQEPSQVEAALDEKGQALTALLEETLHEFHPEIGTTIDEVVATVQPQQVAEATRRLKEDPRTACDLLRCLSVVDYEDRLEVVYHLYSIEKGHNLVVKTSVPYEDPRLPSVIAVWPGADWYEREGMTCSA